MAFRFTLILALLLVAPIAGLAARTQGLLGNLLGLIQIQGTVYCTTTGNAGVNGTATPVFPNAQVQLLCRGLGTIATTTTNGSGAFSILLSPLQVVLSTLVNTCNLVVPTALSTCNSALPATGGLVSGLINTVTGLLNGLLGGVLLIPSGFNFLQNLNLP